MSLEQLLAKRFLYQPPTEEGAKGKLRPVVLISSLGIALGVALILLSLFVVDGFRSEIRGKIVAVVGSVRISNPENSYDQYSIPLMVPDELRQELLACAKDIDREAYLVSFTQQMALLRTDSAYRGVMLLGRSEMGKETGGRLYSDLSDYLVAGDMPRSDSNEVALSQRLAHYLGLSLGDEFTAYFGEGGRLRLRKYQVAGLFDTGFDEYDDNLLLLDEATLKSVNNWDDDEVGGLSIHLSDVKKERALYDACLDLLANRAERYGERYTLFTSQELNYNMFGWLDLLDANVLLILVLMITVAGMTIITGVVVLVLEKVPAIATLKALGQRNGSLKKTFRLMAGYILFRGLLLGNLIALSIAWVQDRWHVVRLDASQYFMNFVPVEIDLNVLLWTNVAVFILVYAFVLIPTSIIARISPAKSLRFE